MSEFLIFIMVLAAFVSAAALLGALKDSEDDEPDDYWNHK